MEGSHGNPHKVRNGKVYFKNVDQFVFGYLVAEKSCILFHKDHGVKKGGVMKEAPVPEGVYELRRQVERTHEGMRVVRD
jgi:hypothetical protein